MYTVDLFIFFLDVFGGSGGFSRSMLVASFSDEGLGSALYFDGSYLLLFIDFLLFYGGGYIVLVVVWFFDFMDGIFMEFT